MSFRNVMAGLCAIASLVTARADESFAERLGWKADEVVVIIHCNDGGVTQGSSRGIQYSLTKGIPSSFSIAMPCPWVPLFIKGIPAQSTDVGVEITLTSEF